MSTMAAALTVARQSLVAVWLASIAVIGVALGFEYIGGFRPCPLCLQQRYPYYFAILFGAAALAARRSAGNTALVRAALGLIAVGYLINTGLGIQHAGVEWKWWAGPDTCSGALPSLSGAPLDLNKRVIRCDEAPWRFAGLSFAGWNAVLSLALAVLAASAALRRRAPPAQ